MDFADAQRLNRFRHIGNFVPSRAAGKNHARHSEILATAHTAAASFAERIAV